MTVIRPNSISGINSITAQSNALAFYDVAGNKLNIDSDITGDVTVATGATISGSTNTITASTNGSERLRITSDGKVGVGEDNVQAHFHVAKNIADSDAINWTGSQLSVATPISGNSTANRATIYFAPYGSDNNYAPSAISASAGTSGASTLKFFTNASGNLTGQVQNYERLRISSTGNIGIGTVPQSWGGFRSLQLGGTTSIWSVEGGQAGSSFYSNNIYFDGSNRRYLTSNAASEYIQDASTGNHIFYGVSSGTAGNTLSGYTEVARFTSSGLKLPSGLGIDFSATANSSGTTTSELLDDYEEGTWTPTLTGFTNAGSSTGRVRNYTRIGNVVTIWFDIFQTSNNMSFSNGATITGLPFSTTIPGGSDDFHTPVVVQYYRYPASTMVNVSAYVETTDTIVFRPASANSDIRHLWGHVTYLTS